MCTVAWGTETGRGLWVCFNRDEQRTRAPAEAPRLYPGPAGPLGYARDPEGGGTWLAVTARGFVVALLNQYETETPVPDTGARRSRGLLVRDLAKLPSAAVAEEHLRTEALTAYAPFHLLILSPGGGVKADWDGGLLAVEEARDGWLTTSSYRPLAIAEARRKAWERFLGGDPKGGPEAVARCLREKAADPAAGMLMDREDARTVSQTEIRLGGGGFRITYRARAEGGEGFEAPIDLIYPGKETDYGPKG